jgi:hypothetical protein
MQRIDFDRGHGEGCHRRLLNLPDTMIPLVGTPGRIAARAL